MPTQSKQRYRKTAERSNWSHRFHCTSYSQMKGSSSQSTEPQIECSCWLHISSIMLSRPVLIKCYHMHVRSLRVAGDQTLFVFTDITQMGCTAAKASPCSVLCRDCEGLSKAHFAGLILGEPLHTTVFIYSAGGKRGLSVLLQSLNIICHAHALGFSLSCTNTGTLQPLAASLSLL